MACLFNSNDDHHRLNRYAAQVFLVLYWQYLVTTRYSKQIGLTQYQTIIGVLILYAS